MNLSNFIPTGRTSLVKKGSVSLQVQTEYAYRPYPRLTTTILNNGQVLHKIEKKLDKPIESFDEQSVMEVRMKSQHNDVVNIIKEHDPSGLLNKIPGSNQPVINSEQSVVDKPQIPSEKRETTVKFVNPDLLKSTDDTELKTKSDQFKIIEGVKYVYNLNNEGGFVSRIESEHFKKAFSAVFKSIGDLIDIFSILPGETIRREKGVYEIERDSLYLVSAGHDIFFITLENPNKDINYEQMFKTVVNRMV